MINPEISEQIQQDLMGFMDGMDQGFIDHACQIVVDNFKKGEKNTESFAQFTTDTGFSEILIVDNLSETEAVRLSDLMERGRGEKVIEVKMFSASYQDVFIHPCG